MDKEGIVTYVAQTGGVKLEGSEVYLNPTDACKKFVKKELTGKKVLLDMTDDTHFKFIKVITGPASTTSGSTPGRITENKEVDWDAKDRKIIRMNCLAHATELVVNNKIELDELIEYAIKLETWIRGD